MNTLTRSLRFSPLLSLIGLIIGAIHVVHYYDVRSGLSGFASFCKISENFNCRLVDMSPHASLIFGLPLSAFYVAWCLFLLVVSYFIFNVPTRREALRLYLISSTIGLLVSIYYFFVMTFLIKTYCLYCLGIDFVNVLHFLIAFAARPDREKSDFQTHPWQKSFWMKMALALGILQIAVSGFIGLVLSEKLGPSSDKIATHVQKILDGPQYLVSTEGVTTTIGPDSASIKVVKFSDFQCPACRMAAQSIHAAMDAFPGKIQLIYKHFPLDSSCNRNIDRPMHPYACELARMSVCAGKQGKFGAFYETIFENQSDIRGDRLDALVFNIGLDWDIFSECLKTQEPTQVVLKDIEEGITTLNIESTPTFYVNGKKIAGALPPSAWIELFKRLQ